MYSITLLIHAKDIIYNCYRFEIGHFQLVQYLGCQIWTMFLVGVYPNQTLLLLKGLLLIYKAKWFDHQKIWDNQRCTAIQIKHFLLYYCILITYKNNTINSQLKYKHALLQEAVNHTKPNQTVETWHLVLL